MRAELIGGELRGIEASNLDFREGSDGWALVGGSGAIGSFADVRYAVAIGALKSRKTVAGTLSTSKEAVSKGAPTVTANYARSPDGQKFSLSLSVSELEALGTVIITPDGSVTIRRVTIAGKYDASQAGAKASATLTGLTIGAIDWKAGSGRLRGTGPITAKQVTLAASATADVPARDGQPAKKGAWTVTDIVIASLDGTGLHYTDPPLDIHFGRDDKPANPGEAPLRIGRVHIRPAKGQLSITDLSADFGGNLTKSLQVGGHMSVDSLSLDLYRGDHLVAVVHGVTADAKLSGDYSGAIAVNGFGGAKIDVGPDGITVGSDDEKDDGVRIEQLGLERHPDLGSAQSRHQQGRGGQVRALVRALRPAQGARADRGAEGGADASAEGGTGEEGGQEPGDTGQPGDTQAGHGPYWAALTEQEAEGPRWVGHTGGL